MLSVILGVDVGTSSTRVVIFDLEGIEIASASSAPYHNFTPQPGWVEQDPQGLWQALISTIKSAIESANQTLNILSLCMSVQSGSLLPVDGNGEPVYPLITWLDGRAEGIVNEWKSAGHQGWVKATSGWSLYPSLCLPTIAWLKKNRPDIVAATRTYFSLNDFLVFRLTGKYVTNPSNGGGMQLVDIHSGEWSVELVKLAGIETGQLAQMLPSCHLIGTILPEVCRETGLNATAVLVNGGHDQGCTAVGLGIIEPGRWLLACGTAWVFTGIMQSPTMADLPASLDVNFHAVPNRWTISQSLGGLGASFEWWLQKSFQLSENENQRAEMLAVLNQEMSQTDIDPELFFLPLTGGHSDPATTRRGGFIGLQLGHSRADLARAIMQSAAYELKWALESVHNAGIPLERFWMVGGAARSTLWPQILADVTGNSINLPQYDNWSALGAAIMAGVAVGAFTSIESALSRFQKPALCVQPQPEMEKRFQENFLQYQQWVNKLQ